MMIMTCFTAIPKANLSRAFYKRTTPSLKRRIGMKRREMNLTRETNGNHRRQYDPTPWHPIIRSMLPITRHQSRFKVVTQRHLRNNSYSNIERPTQGSYYRRRRGRSSHSPYGILQIFPQLPVEKKKGESHEGFVDRLRAVSNA